MIIVQKNEPASGRTAHKQLMLYLRVVKSEGFALASVGTNVCKRRFLGALDFDGFAVKRQSVERSPKNGIFVELAARRHHEGVVRAFKHAPCNRLVFDAESDCRHS